MELQVGRSDWVQDMEYKTLLPTVCLTSPIECRNGEGTLKTRTFSSEHFCTEVNKEKWDRIKVICRQPFRKDVQFGLTYIRIKSATLPTTENTNILQSSTTDNGINGKIAEDMSVVKSIQKHFFGRTFLNNKERVDPLQSKLLKIAGSSENGIEHEVALPRTAKLVLAAAESIGKYSPQSRAKSNSSVKGQLFSERLVQKYGPKFEDEVIEFLGTLQLEDFDLDNITIADLRHRFEKIQKRKLCGEEKRIFMELCQNYICDLFDKVDNKTSKLPQNSECVIENEFYPDKPSRKRKANGDRNLSSPKTKKAEMNGIGKPKPVTSTTNSKVDPLNYRYTPTKTFSDFSIKSLKNCSKSLSTTDGKQMSIVESCNGRINANHKVTPSKSKVMKPQTFLSSTNHKRSSVKEDSLLNNKDVGSNNVHQSDSTKTSPRMGMSATTKSSCDHSHIQSLVAAIKKNFPNSSPPITKPVTKEVSYTNKTCTTTEQSATKSFPYRGLQLEIGSVNSRAKAPSINKLVSDIHSSASRSKDIWLSKEKGLRCNNVHTSDHLDSPVSSVKRGRGTPVTGTPTARSRGGKPGMGSTSSTGDATGQMRGVSNGQKVNDDDWSEADFDLRFNEDAVDSPSYVFCSTCKGNVPEHLYSHHYLTCCSSDLTSPTGRFPSSGISSSPSTAHNSQVNQQDKYWTVLSSDDSDSDLDISVKQNEKCVSCPICEEMFPEDVIMTHANFCCETIGFR